jgi:hypothetical protein
MYGVWIDLEIMDLAFANNTKTRSLHMVGHSGWNLAIGNTKVGTTVTQLKTNHNANA